MSSTLGLLLPPEIGVPVMLRLNQPSTRGRRHRMVGRVIETDTGVRATAIGNGQSHRTAAITADRLSMLDETERRIRFPWDLVDVDDIRTEVAEAGILIETN